MSAGTRNLLLQLAANIIAGKRDAEVCASEIVGWIAVTDLYESLFADLVTAVRVGDVEGQARLLNALAGQEVAA